MDISKDSDQSLVKKCFEFACEASFKKSTIPEYKKEYQEIEDRLGFPNKF